MEAPLDGGVANAPTRAARAREWIRVLADLPERFAGTASERKAAERIAVWMQETGIADVSVPSVPGRAHTALLFAVHGGLAALGCWMGGFLGMLMAVLAAWSFSSDLRRRRPVLARLLPAPDSVNVVGRIGPSEPAQRIVVSAHIDTTRAALIFRPFWADFFARFQQRGDRLPPGALAVPEFLLFAGAGVTIVAWLGAHGLLFGLARVGLLVGLLIVCGIGLQWLASPPTPGANDNASAVAAMLLCAEKLSGRLPPDTELWLVGTGSEEDGCNGMHAFVDRHRDWPKDRTYFVNFECVGGGTFHYVNSEGMLARSTYPPPLLEVARRVAAGGAFGAVTPADLLAATDGHVPAELGYPTLSLICLEANGVPRNYHRVEDTVDFIDLDSVVRAADFGAAVVLAAARGASGPIENLTPD